MTFDELALEILRELLRKSGVREWADEEVRQAIVQAAAEMAWNILYLGGGLMPTKTLLTPMDGTPKQICFADHAADFNPTAANDLRASTDGSLELDVQLDLTSLANGAACQSAKVDLGAHWAEECAVRAAFELAATPTAGAIIQLYWAPSHHATAGIGNPANITGVDGAYAGYSANLASSVVQLQMLKPFVCTVQASGTIQVGLAGKFRPTHRYGSLVVLNASGAAFHSDAVESHIVFDPILPEFQN